MTWEERWHPLREEWVIIAAHRQDRPWSGDVVATEKRPLPEYVPDCYLCPGNARVGGARNPDYRETFVFDNDHPCVGPQAPLALAPLPAVYRNRPASGLARVVCYTPKHNTSLAEMNAAEVDALLGVWQAQYRELSRVKGVAHVLVFENKGEVVGVSNPHPHGQIYALAAVLKRVLVQYDNLWQLSFPYVMALHQAPTDGGDYRAFHFHVELHPPLRKPGLLKYLAGPEIGGGSFLSDTTPEEKAAELRAQPDTHYRRATGSGNR